MWSKLEPIFEQLQLPYFRQGSFADDEEMPGSFFTFWNADTPERGYFDNKANCAVWYWYVYFYTNEPSLLYSKLDEFIKLCKGAGFIVEGRGKDIASGQVDYLGRYVQIKYVEQYNLLGGKTNE